MEQVEQVESESAVVDEGGTVDSPGRRTGARDGGAGGAGRARVRHGNRRKSWKSRLGSEEGECSKFVTSSTDISNLVVLKNGLFGREKILGMLLRRDVAGQTEISNSEQLRPP